VFEEVSPGPAGHCPAELCTFDDIVAGREGQYRVRLMKNTKAFDCAYPGVEILPDGTFATVTYGHWTKDEPPYILCIRFRLDELDAQSRKKD